MRTMATIGVLALLGVAACEDTGSTEVSTTALRSGTPEAEAACVDAVNTNYGSAVSSVTSSEFSEAGTSVMLTAEGETWRCLASNDGNVEEVSVQEAVAG